MKISVLAAAVLVTATGAIAAPQADDGTAERAATTTPAEQAQSTAADAEPDVQEERKICRTERATGSLTRRTRICMTATQWNEIHDRTRKGVSEMQGSASGSQAIVNNPGG